MSSGSEIGKRIKLQRGALISDDLMGEIIKKYMGTIDHNKGILFDGFPRTLGQAVLLQDILH